MEQEESFIVVGNAKQYSHSGDCLAVFFTKLNTLLPYDPVDIYPNELKHMSPYNTSHE